MNTNEIKELVQKNLKNLIRAKTSSLIIILGPLIVIMLAGFAFDNTSAYSIKVGTYAPEQTNVTTDFINQLKTKFKVIEYQTEQECTDAIKDTEINTCMIFDANFTVGKPTQNQVTFYIDYSKLNLAWTLMQTMTEEVGDKTLEESKLLTKTLLETISYTEQQIANQRDTVVKLTTNNELITKNVQDLMAELGDIDLTFNTEGFTIDELQSAKTQVKQWTDTTIELGEKGLNKAKSYLDAADELIKNSGASQQTKDQVLANFQESVKEMDELKENFDETKALTEQSIARLDEQIEKISNSITETQTRLQEADTSRQFSLRVLQAIIELLDKSLLHLSEIQHSINQISTKINNIQIRDPNAVTQPIVTTIKPIVQEKTYLNYLFPILITLIIMFTALLVTPTLILLDKNSPASFRTYMTPVKDTSYVIASYITAAIIILTQIIIILAIASIFFTEIIMNIPTAIIVLLLTSSVFILIGMIIGNAFNTEETATLAAISTGAIFLFISDVIVPLESMPEAISYIASFNPYILGSTLLRKALIYDSTIISMIPDLLLVIGYIIALSFIATGTYLLTRKYTLRQLIKEITPEFFRKKKL